MIVAGFGYRSGATLDSLRAALVLAQQGTPPVTHVASLPDKLPLLAGLGLPMFPAAALAGIPTQTHSAAGPGARLLVPRIVSPDRMATCAIAQGSCS